MFLPREPSGAKVAAFIRSQEDKPFSYKEVGVSRERPSKIDGYVVDHNRAWLGAGEEVFVRAAEALRAWQMFDVGWVRIRHPGTPIETGNTVAVLGNHYGFWSLNACRIVYLVEDAAMVRSFGFAYGTLPEHAERGEERFAVEWAPDDSVWYDLYAFSKPNSVLARVGKPFARGLQRRFAEDSMREMQRAVQQATGGL